MANRSVTLTDALYDYMVDIGVRESALMARLRAETASHPLSDMQIAPEQGQFMTFLVRMLGVKTALEVGVFTGYSSLAVATALPEDGLLIACDISDTYTSIARRYWKEAGVEARIDLRLGAAADTLVRLVDEGYSESIDFAFIDADKTGYRAYFERVLTLLRPGGILLLDNVFMGGRVVDPTNRQEGVEAMRALNETLATDDRVDLCVLPVADGLTLAMKR